MLAAAFVPERLHLFQKRALFVRAPTCMIVHGVQWTCRRTIPIEAVRARVGLLPTTGVLGAAAVTVA